MKPGYEPGAEISEAKIIATYPRTRTVDIQFLSNDRNRHNVLVVGGYGDYSFPHVGDIVFVLSSQHKDYCFGVLEHFYAAKLDGKVKDPVSGERVLVKKINDGEVFLYNIMRRALLFLSNSGNFSLISSDNDGLSYYLKNRYLRLKGQITQIIGSGTTAAFGYVYRNRGKGYEPIPSTENPLAPAVEFLTEVVFNKLKVARIQIGHVKDALGIDEVSSFGSLLQAVLEVFSGGISVARLKMDKSGNIELSSVAKTMLDGIEVLLGGITAAEPVIKGSSYTSAEAQFLTDLTTFLAQFSAFAGVLSATTDPSKLGPMAASATSVLTPAIANMLASTATFSSSLPKHLSLKTKTS